MPSTNSTREIDPGLEFAPNRHSRTKTFTCTKRSLLSPAQGIGRNTPYVSAGVHPELLAQAPNALCAPPVTASAHQTRPYSILCTLLTHVQPAIVVGVCEYTVKCKRQRHKCQERTEPPHLSVHRTTRAVQHHRRHNCWACWASPRSYSS